MALLSGFRRYRLPCFLVIAICLFAVPAQGHHMGRSVPIGYAGEGSIHLVAQVIASYFEEQMGRETKLIKAGSAAEGLQLLRNREFPMVVLPTAAADDLPEGILRLDGIFGKPGRTVVLVIGADAKEKLEFSLVQRYLDKLSKSFTPADWEKATELVEKGEGIRGVALDMLREADLI